ncbi:MAG: SDR family NAD(P)-dependent oxidoreductase, partial [Fidelibacterota bacterium]
MSEFTGRVAVITGASRGIGKAIAETLAESRGWTAEARTCDVSDFAQVQSVFKSIIAEAGQIHILINNAGVTRDTLLLRMTEADWDFVLNINLKGAFNGIKAAVRSM